MSEDRVATLLLLLRLKAFAPTELLASTLDEQLTDIDAQLRQLGSLGWVQHRRGTAAGWSLTAEGRRHGERLLRAELEIAGTAAQLHASYQEFLALNADLLAVCTDWQTMVVDGALVPNDHADPVRDGAVLDRLSDLHLAAVPVLDALSAALGRFAGYRGRLDRAHRHVRDGRTEWIAKPTVDSYHGVWFELHEHLLVTLDRDRSSEPVPQYTPTPDGDSR